MAESRFVIVYQFPVSHYCEKVRWILAAKGLPHEIANLFPGMHSRLLRARGGTTVPALQDGATFVADSSAIALYLEQRAAVPPLLPSDPDERRSVLEWVQYFDADIGPAVRVLVYSYLTERSTSFVRAFFSGYGRLQRLAGAAANVPIRRWIRRTYGIDVVARDLARHKVFAAMDRLEHALGQRRSFFLFGDALSLADITTAALLAPLIMPAKSPYHDASVFPSEILAMRDDLRTRPGGQWVLALYAAHR
ncbi:MAG TPA: glutathione S-transferase family protein [Polyangiaceae bacterium]|nr:glutathione S-transferase family protein [Polyangiaceae bacterium]